MKLKKCLAYIPIFLLLIWNQHSHSNSLETVIAPQIGATFVNETRSSSAEKNHLSRGLRYNARFDFMNIPDHVSVNMTSAYGLNFLDLGAQFRVYDYTQKRGSSVFDIFYGIGAGLNVSPGYRAEIAAQKTPFADFLLSPYFRLHLDTQNQWGIFIEGAYELILQRVFLRKGIAADLGLSHRFVFMVGIPFEFSYQF